MRLYLIAHAHTRQIAEVVATRWQLSNQGRDQAEALAAQPFWGEVEQIVVSSERKTWLTAAPSAARHSLPIHVDCRFDELRRPGWVEDYASRVVTALAKPNEPAGDWEAASIALARFRAGVRDVERRFAGKVVALIGHGLTLSLFRAWLLRREKAALEDWAGLGFGAWALVDTEHRIILQDFALTRGQRIGL